MDMGIELAPAVSRLCQKVAKRHLAIVGLGKKTLTIAKQCGDDIRTIGNETGLKGVLLFDLIRKSTNTTTSNATFYNYVRISENWAKIETLPSDWLFEMGIVQALEMLRKKPEQEEALATFAEHETPLNTDNPAEHETPLNTDKTEAELRQCWETPKKLFDELHGIFGFTVDAFAIKGNAKLDRFWEDAASQEWAGETAFANPPFSTIGNFFPFFSKAKTSLVIAPLTSLCTKYLHANPPKLVFVPASCMTFDPPEGLPAPSRTTAKRSGFATVIHLFGDYTTEQAKRVCAVSVDGPFRCLEWQA